EHRALPRQKLGRTWVCGAAAPWVVPAEGGLGRRLDAVGALAEVDLAQAFGEDLVLRPFALQAVRQRRLAQLLEDRTASLGLGRGASGDGTAPAGAVPGG